MNFFGLISLKNESQKECGDKLLIQDKRYSALFKDV